jgi:TusA-related sulfurtransferase
VLLLVRNAMARVDAGDVVEVRSPSDDLRDDLASWCRLNGCELLADLDAGPGRVYLLRKGQGAAAWEHPDWDVRIPRRPGGAIDLRDWLVGRAGEVPEEVPTYYGFVPRGAVAEPGMPEFPFTLNRKVDVWADNIAALYEQAKSQQWNASEDIHGIASSPFPRTSSGRSAS